MTNSAPSNSAGLRSSSRISTRGHGLVEGESISGSSGMSYRPLLELGEGGMARIVLALATGPGGFNKLVVLKVMRTGQDTTEIRRLLLAEARLSARLNHPNVVQVQEVVEAEEAPYLVMEYLDGRPLSALRISDTFTPGMLMTAISETLVGLHYAHELHDFDGTPLHIVHRDVSPHNVFLTYDGAVKVLDFGIAKMMRYDTSNTETGEVKGKLMYMPPEQLLGEKLDRRADIFAVGCMLWEAATGARMWANVSQANLMHRLISGNIPRPSEVKPVDPELERIITRATAASPDERYETAQEMQQELDAYLEGSGQRAVLREVGAALAEAYQADRQERARSIKEALRHNSVPPPPGAPVDLATGSEPKLATPPQKAHKAWPVAVVLLLGLVVVLLMLRMRHAPAPLANEAPPSAAAPAASALTVGAPEPTPAQPEAAPSNRESPHISGTSTHAKGAPAPAVALGKHAAVNAGSAQNQTAPAAPAPAAPSTDCNPPYFFDHGIKTYKPQCL